jgi:intein/homing endonuclease
LIADQEKSFFDTMGGEFDARLKLTTRTTRTSKSDGRELTVSNPLAIIEARFSYKVLDRLYFPSFVAIERDVGGEKRYVMYEVVGVTPTHYQLPGIDSSMPTLLRKEYLDTINESWGKSQETWIDLSAIPTNYNAKVEGGTMEFTRAPYAPLPGAKAWLLSKPAVEKFLCVAGGETIGTMAGFDLPFTVDMDNLIRYHAGFFAFSLDHAEPIIYREAGRVKVGPIGELVDRFFVGNSEGRRYTSSIEVVSFDPETLRVEWSTLQYVFRHRYEGKLLRFKLRTGRSVVVSPGHSLYVLRDGKIRSLDSTALHEGDYLVGTRLAPPKNTEFQQINLLESSDMAGAEGLRLTGLGASIIDSLEIQAPGWKRWRWRHFGFLPAEFYGRIGEESRIKARLAYKNCQHPLEIFLAVDEEVARLFGYYTAEGHTKLAPGESYDVQFTLNRRKDGAIVTDIRRIARRKFGVRATVSRHGEGALRVTISNKILAYLFSSIVGKGARNKRVPNCILNSPSSIRSAFVRAWAAGDYGATSSRPLMNDVMYLLLMDGITATASEWTGEGHAEIEGRRVSATPRYQMFFPRGPELQQGISRKRRGRAEPTVPVEALSSAVKSLLQHPSHISRTKPRLSGKLLESMGARLEKLNSYPGSGLKDVKDARHDGYYRTSIGKHLSKKGNRIVATQLLVDAAQEFAYAKALTESNLTFYEIESIDEALATSPFVYDVSVPRNENFLAGFGGIFCHNTGSGKSNLASSLLRTALKRDPSLTAVVIDIAGEYAVNLLDQLGDQARMITTETFDNEQEFISSQAIPESLEETAGRKAVEQALSKVWARGVDRLSLQEGSGIDLAWIQQLFENTVDSAKAGGTAAKIALARLTMEFYEKSGYRQSTKLTDLDEAARKALTALLTDLSQKVHEKSGLKADIDLILDMLETGDFGPALSTRLSPEKLAEQLAKGQAPRLNVLYLPEPIQARIATERLIKRLLFLKKKYGNRQRVLFLLDEAQEYIPDEHTERDYTTQSNRAVEQLLRQGRKYRLHCWMATQRVARLNVNALQQLHSYFVSTLPRMYDRMVIADAFALPYEVLERSADLGTGEWLFVSFKAAKQRNVPVFLKTENNENFVAERLK